MLKQDGIYINYLICKEAPLVFLSISETMKYMILFHFMQYFLGCYEAFLRLFSLFPFLKKQKVSRPNTLDQCYRFSTYDNHRGAPERKATLEALLNDQHSSGTAKYELSIKNYFVVELG